MALIDDFCNRFPEFDCTNVDAVFPALEAEWPCYYGRPYDAECDKAAILMLLAHLYTLETQANAGKSQGMQTVASKSVGSVSVSYAAPTQTGGSNYDFFNSTIYGQRFLRMTMKHRGACFV